MSTYYNESFGYSITNKITTFLTALTAALGIGANNVFGITVYIQELI